MSDTETLELIRGGMHPAEATSIDRDDAIILIREALKKRSGKTWSVTGDRGTAWGWINISSPPKRRVDHVANPAYDPSDHWSTEPNTFDVAPPPHRNGYYMSEADRAELGELLGLGRPVHCQGESIAASWEYRREYVARARGLEPTKNAVPYWD